MANWNIIPYERIAGKSHYPLVKMLALALEGITSLSIRPLRLIVEMGIIGAIISIIGIAWALLKDLNGYTITGWTSMVCIVCFIGSIQLICIGIIGEYIGKIYMEVKQRPRYIIGERTYEKEENSLDSNDCHSSRVGGGKFYILIMISKRLFSRWNQQIKYRVNAPNFYYRNAPTEILDI